MQTFPHAGGVKTDYKSEDPPVSCRLRCFHLRVHQFEPRPGPDDGLNRWRPAKEIAVDVDTLECGRLMRLVPTFKAHLLVSSEVGLRDNPARFAHFLPLTHGGKISITISLCENANGSRCDAGSGLFGATCFCARRHPCRTRVSSHFLLCPGFFFRIWRARLCPRFLRSHP